MIKKLVSCSSLIGRTLVVLLVSSSFAFAQFAPRQITKPVFTEIKPIEMLGPPRPLDPILPHTQSLEQFKQAHLNSYDVPNTKKLNVSRGFIRADDIKIVCSSANEKAKIEAQIRLKMSFQIQLSAKQIPSQDIRDVTSDIFKRIAANCLVINSRNPSELGGVGARILRSAAIDYWRKTRKPQAVSLEETCKTKLHSDDTWTGDQGFINKVRTDYKVEKIIDQLSKREGQLLQLLISGYSIDEVQRNMGISPNNFHQISHNLKKKVAALVCS